MGIVGFDRWRRLALPCALLCAGLAANAAEARTISGSGKAVIVQPLTLVKTADLNFGAIVPATTAGTVTIDSGTGALSKTGALTPSGGSPGRATFVGVTDGFGFVQVTIPSTGITLTRAGGGAMNGTLVLGDLPGFQLGNTPTSKIAFIGDNNAFTFGIGGTLNVGANQQQGVYTATFTVTANYF